MNRTLLACLLLVCALTGLAQNKVALESGGVTTFHNTVEEAVSAAQAGAVIHVPGGVWVNAPLTIDKALTIIGVGFDPDSTEATGATIFQDEIRFAAGASNTAFIGIHFGACVEASYANSVYATVNNLVFIRCHLYDFDGTACGAGTGSHFSNLYFDGCILDQAISLNGATNTTFKYCILGFQNTTGSVGLLSIEHSIIFFLGTSPMTFTTGVLRDCILFGSPSYPLFSPYSVSTTQSITVANNIIVSASPTGYISSGFETVQSTNNVFVGTSGGLFQSFSGSTFSFAHDYHLAIGSPAIGAGYGGVDCGIYGGPNPWKEGAVPPNPHISFQSIGSTTNGQGQLPATIKVTAQDR